MHTIDISVVRGRSYKKFQYKNLSYEFTNTKISKSIGHKIDFPLIRTLFAVIAI